MNPDEEELRVHVRLVIWEPVEPIFMWLARKLSKWLV